MCVIKCVKRFLRDEYMHKPPRFLGKIEGVFIFSEPTSNGLTVRSSFYATFMGFYRHITHLRNPTITNICSHKQNIMCSKF